MLCCYLYKCWTEPPVQGNVDWEGGGGPEVGDEVPLDDVALRAAEVQPRGGEAEAAALTQSPQLDGRAHYICPQNVLDSNPGYKCSSNSQSPIIEEM